MALIGRYTVLSKHPGRANGGSGSGEGMNLGDFNKASRWRARFTSADYSSKAAVPDGYRPPATWIMPQSAGALSAYTTILGDGELAGSGARGKNAEAALTGSGDLTATGQLVVSAVAALAGTGALSGNVVAVLSATATLTGSGSVSGAMGALGWLDSDLAGVGSVTATRYATGELAAEITPFSELSPQSLADAVWAAPEGSFIYALMHNKVITDPVGGTFTVYDSDGTTVLYVADLFQDAAGATPYAGAGSERRDEFA